MTATSQLNNNNETANEENNSRPTPEPELDLLDYSEEMTRDINSVPPLQNAFGNLGSSLPQINEDDMRPQAQGARPSESGISPALINSRATSLALETMSNRSTPVPRPVERQTFAVHTSTATNLTIQSPTPRQFNQNPIPTLSPSPAPTGQVDIIVDNQDLEVFINLFNDQWLMFIQARDNNNVPFMRAALTQAISSQEVIRDLAGGEEMLRISENWIAREELADLERSQQANPTPPVQRLAITQRAHSHTISPSPAPQPLTRQASEITYLGSGQQQLQNQTTSQRPPTAHRQHQDIRTQSAQGNHLPPPPPPSTQPPRASEHYNQHQQVQHHPYYRQGTLQHHQQPPRFVQNYEAPQQGQAAQTHAPPHQQFHPPQQRNWRGYGRNWRAPQDPTTRLLQVGEYLMRAKGVATRVFRFRGRGRGRNQVQRRDYQQEEQRH
ncbi:uncharacterized protein PGTG_03389 [Puccinia graminis f. sp. tritici CRL 75-36-700-3]|uniref:Uncharacterized protein n=1 Tax=Puccinia graminis f. sp. tritici (strain CRL 75-36-700-3 / race SCCL) TaxID=418459 RepID=E3JZF8_PUCGT|nr:uncharacterized protein PGTG_03389 [Puccinia graminis f. sp. tritici CRL 75-36-700-3]EFP77433.1 hypothetical protein PGTG_03389 [Puccinia graminis f. sp. tritici CRL 75-36-700-3]